MFRFWRAQQSRAGLERAEVDRGGGGGDGEEWGRGLGQAACCGVGFGVCICMHARQETDMVRRVWVWGICVH